VELTSFFSCAAHRQNADARFDANLPARLLQSLTQRHPVLPDAGQRFDGQNGNVFFIRQARLSELPVGGDVRAGDTSFFTIAQTATRRIQAAKRKRLKWRCPRLNPLLTAGIRRICILHLNYVADCIFNVP